MTDYTKLIERLESDIALTPVSAIAREAADAIEALQEENALLEGTLESRERNIAEMQAENERLKVESTNKNDWLVEQRKWEAHANALQAKLDAMGKGEPVAYSVGNTLKWHEGKGMTNAQLYAAPKALAPLAIPADVLEAAVNMKTNHYRGPLAWAVKVIDFVADHGIGGTP